MKVTLSAAMRARDVSRPRPEDEEAAKEAASQPPAGNTRPRPDRTEGGGRPAASKNAGGGRRRKRS
jgi:hypothetical protein